MRYVLNDVNLFFAKERKNVSEQKQHYNAGLKTRLLSGFFLIYRFLKAFFFTVVPYRHRETRA